MLYNLKFEKFDLYFAFALLLVHLLFGLQCLNFCDEVFIISSAQHFFSSPESISYIFMYYLGAFFAGVWNYFFADWGIYGFRVFNAIIITLTYYISYRTLKPYVNKWCIVAGVFLSILAETSDVTTVIHHNSVTCLFTTCAVYFMMKGLTKEKGLPFWVAGTILGINVFSRVTNIALLGLVLSLLPYGFYRKNSSKSYSFAVQFIIGFIVGVIIVLLLMLSLGHLYLFVDILNMLASVSQDPLGGHNIWQMLSVYVLEYLIIFGIILYLIAGITIGRRLKITTNHVNIKTIYVFVLTLPLVLIAYSDTLKHLFLFIHFYYAIMTYLFIYTICNNYSGIYLKYLSIISLLVIYLQPLGGDYGIDNMHSCSIRLAMPLAIGILGNILIKQNDELYKYVFIPVICILVIWGSNTIIFHRAWYDGSSRFEYTTMPKSKNANVYLKEKYAFLVDDVMAQLDKYKNNYNSLFVIGYMPLFNYLTGMQPYVQCCTPDFFSPLMLKKQVERAEKRHCGKLPLVIRGMSRGSIIEDYNPDWRNLEKMAPRNREQFKIYEDFLARHHYKEVWREESFAILLPGE